MCADQWVINAGRNDVECELAGCVCFKGKANGHVVTGTGFDFGRVAIEQVRELDDHPLWYIRRHRESVSTVPVIANFERHGLGRVARNVRLVCIFIRDVNGCCVKDFNAE